MSAPATPAGAPPAGSPRRGPLAIASLVLALVLVLIATSVPMESNDFWLQARIGRMIAETGEIPRTLLFPFTEVRDRAFNMHEWLPSVLFHLFVSTVGEDELRLVLGGFGLLLFALAASLAWRLTRSFGASLLLALLAMAVANYRHYLRPEIVALVFLLALLHLLVAFQQDGRRRRLLWSVPLAVIWANSHGSFLLGPVVAGIFAVGEAAQAAWPRRSHGMAAWAGAARQAGGPYAAVAAAMALASLLNPLGWGMYQFALQLTTSEAVRTILTEWQPTLSPKYLGRRYIVLFLGVLAAALALVLVRRDRLRWTDWLLLAAFGLLAFRALRFPVLFGFVAIVPCARAIGLRPPAQVERRMVGAATVLAACALPLVLKFGNGYGAWPYYAPSANFTLMMRERIEDPDLRGNVFNHAVLGPELIYRAWPRLKPVVDTRADSYGDAYYVAVIDLLNDETRLRAFLDEYDVNYMLLMREDFDDTVRHMKALRQDGWRGYFQDHKAVLLYRSKPKAPARP
ncbi:hypothetical protein FN976_19935 [Caenimonas sedimenti]|uniref:Glycosyltransferase RgtA/B/C/D-like domain-containing protein n=1 Tax=Caenimonas sedimenti TaxID=2596921 RepID=A0A562ZKJ8_9BURK|nr:hypothetical protein [Caenimonas sedimenti]TWO69013.1 hypothetical protein FN976_19935 [Caenimonas sedimenti]